MKLKVVSERTVQIPREMFALVMSSPVQITALFETENDALMFRDLVSDKHASGHEYLLVRVLMEG